MTGLTRRQRTAQQILLRACLSKSVSRRQDVAEIPAGLVTGRGDIVVLPTRAVRKLQRVPAGSVCRVSGNRKLAGKLPGCEALRKQLPSWRKMKLSEDNPNLSSHQSGHSLKPKECSRGSSRSRNSSSPYPSRWALPEREDGGNSAESLDEIIHCTCLNRTPYNHKLSTPLKSDNSCQCKINKRVRQIDRNITTVSEAQTQTQDIWKHQSRSRDHLSEDSGRSSEILLRNRIYSGEELKPARNPSKSNSENSKHASKCKLKGSGVTFKNVGGYRIKTASDYNPNRCSGSLLNQVEKISRPPTLNASRWSLKIPSNTEMQEYLDAADQENTRLKVCPSNHNCCESQVRKSRTSRASNDQSQGKCSSIKTRRGSDRNSRMGNSFQGSHGKKCSSKATRRGNPTEEDRVEESGCSRRNRQTSMSSRFLSNDEDETEKRTSRYQSNPIKNGADPFRINEYSDGACPSYEKIMPRGFSDQLSCGKTQPNQQRGRPKGYNSGLGIGSTNCIPRSRASGSLDRLGGSGVSCRTGNSGRGTTRGPGCKPLDATSNRKCTEACTQTSEFLMACRTDQNEATCSHKTDQGSLESHRYSLPTSSPSQSNEMKFNQYELCEMDMNSQYSTDLEKNASSQELCKSEHLSNPMALHLVQSSSFTFQPDQNEYDLVRVKSGEFSENGSNQSAEDASCSRRSSDGRDQREDKCDVNKILDLLQRTVAGLEEEINKAKGYESVRSTKVDSRQKVRQITNLSYEPSSRPFWQKRFSDSYQYNGNPYTNCATDIKASPAVYKYPGNVEIPYRNALDGGFNSTQQAYQFGYQASMDTEFVPCKADEAPLINRRGFNERLERIFKETEEFPRSYRYKTNQTENGFRCCNPDCIHRERKASVARKSPKPYGESVGLRRGIYFIDPGAHKYKQSHQRRQSFSLKRVEFDKQQQARGSNLEVCENPRCSNKLQHSVNKSNVCKKQCPDKIRKKIPIPKYYKVFDYELCENPNCYNKTRICENPQCPDKVSRNVDHIKKNTERKYNKVFDCALCENPNCSHKKNNLSLNKTRTCESPKCPDKVSKNIEQNKNNTEERYFKVLDCALCENPNCSNKKRDQKMNPSLKINRICQNAIVSRNIYDNRDENKQRRIKFHESPNNPNKKTDQKNNQDRSFNKSILSENPQCPDKVPKNTDHRYKKESRSEDTSNEDLINKRSRQSSGKSDRSDDDCSQNKYQLKNSRPRAIKTKRNPLSKIFNLCLIPEIPAPISVRNRHNPYMTTDLVLNSYDRHILRNFEKYKMEKSKAQECVKVASEETVEDPETDAGESLCNCQAKESYEYENNSKSKSKSSIFSCCKRPPRKETNRNQKKTYSNTSIPPKKETRRNADKEYESPKSKRELEEKPSRLKGFQFRDRIARVFELRPSSKIVYTNQQKELVRPVDKYLCDDDQPRKDKESCNYKSGADSPFTCPCAHEEHDNEELKVLYDSSFRFSKGCSSSEIFQNCYYYNNPQEPGEQELASTSTFCRQRFEDPEDDNRPCTRDNGFYKLCNKYD